MTCKKLFAYFLILTLVFCLLPAGASAEEASAGESEILTVAEGESVYAYEGMTVYNNGGTVFNNLATVYNNGGTVYLNGGIVFNNNGLVYANRGTVYNNAGKVYRHEADVYSFTDDDARSSALVFRYYELRLADYYAPYVDIEGVTTEPGAEKMIIGEDSVCRITPHSGYSIAGASTDAGDLLRNDDGSISLVNVDADTVLTLEIEKVSSEKFIDGTYNCA